MKKIYILFVAIIFLLLCLIFPPARKAQSQVSVSTPPAVEIPTQELTVIEMINKTAPKWKQDPALISKISYCESHHQVVVHDGGYGKGVTGIHKDTFAGWLPLYQKENGETLNYDSSYDQIKMMEWAFSKGDSYRNQWTTYVAYKNGGTYSFYSRLLKANFTVRCK